MSAVDPLREEGLAYAAKLASAGVPARVRRDAGMLHGYLGAAATVPAAAEALAEAVHWIRERLQPPTLG